MPKTEPTYQELNDELQIILAELQRDDTDVDTAVGQYERGLTIIKKLQDHLSTAENKIVELKAASPAT